MTTYENKVAIITGAGAVENAWLPIPKIYRLIMACDVDSDGANCFFARQVYRLRAYSKFSDEKSVGNLKLEIEDLKTLKGLICEQIKIHQEAGVLKARKEFKSILYKFVFGYPNSLFGFVSTNWDTSIDKEADEIVKEVYTNLERVNCFHIHGSVDFPNNIYLPSETSHENYRSEEEVQMHGINHYNTLKFLKQANRIILYGLSIDPLDAELSQILNSTFTTSSNLQEIIIINPNYTTVRNRVRLLLYPKKHIKVKCFVPENLEIEL